MKRLSLALVALGLSVPVFAALPATTDPTLVAVPLLPGGFVIGGSAFYLEPSVSHGDLDYANVNLTTNTPFAGNIKAIEPGYDWGWGVNVGYIFPQTGNDVNVNYFHFNSDDNSGFFSAPLGGELIFPFISGPFLL